MPLTLLYFVIAGFCIILSVFIILTCLLLKLDNIILLCGIYFALMGIVTVLFTLAYAAPSLPFFRVIPVLIWFIGISAAYPVFALVRPLTEKPFYRWSISVMFIVVIVFQVIAVYEFFFPGELLFMIDNGVITVHPLIQYVYTPFSLTGQIALAVFVALTSHVADKKYRKLLKFMSYGMICMLPFEIVDSYNTFIRTEPLEEYYYSYSFGVFVFSLFFSAMLIQYVREKKAGTSVPDVLPKDSDKQSMNDSYLFQIYQKAVDRISAKKYYTDDTITITILARLLSENRNELSKAINQCYQGNFSSFMNSFRVEELKRLLSIPDQRDSILELGFQVGFKSKTSINRIFYKFTNLSPTEYRNGILKKGPSDLTGNIIIPKN